MKQDMNYVTNALQRIAKRLQEIFSQDHVTFDVYFGGKNYSFFKPMSIAQKDRMDRERKELIHALILDALATSVERGLTDPDTEGLDELETINALYSHSNYVLSSWERVYQFTIPSKEEVASPIDPSTYEEIKLDSTKDVVRSLNADTYTVTMERSDLTEEQRNDKLKELAEKGM